MSSPAVERPRPERVVFSREQLYELVWSEPMRVLAARYAMSDAGLAKACRRMWIPLPGRGYWRRLETGYPVVRPDLPTLPVTAALNQRQITLTLRTDQVLTPAAPDETPVGRQRAYEAMPEHRIVVAASLKDAAPLHPLVAEIRRALPRARPDVQGVLRPVLDAATDATSGTPSGAMSGALSAVAVEAPTAWAPPRKRTAPALPFGALDVAVTASSVDRALCVLDALVKALEARGYPVSCQARVAPLARGARRGRAKPAVMTRVEVGEEDVYLSLQEVVSRATPTVVPAAPSPPSALTGRIRHATWDAHSARAPSPAFVGTGRLAITIPHSLANQPEFWRLEEGRQGGRLEESLGEVVVAVVAAVVEFQDWRERERLRQEEALARWRCELEAAEHRRREEARVTQLDRQLAAWTRAEDVRSYISALRRAAVASGIELTAEAPVSRWLQWMTAYAERVDPVLELLGQT